MGRITNDSWNYIAEYLFWICTQELGDFERAKTLMQEYLESQGIVEVID